MLQDIIKVHRELGKSLAINLTLPALERLSVSLSESSTQFIISLGQSLFLIVHLYRSHQELNLDRGHVALLL